GSGTAYASGNTFTITASTTLYAQWTPTGNTVTFNANGGTGSMTPQMDCTAANLTSNTFTYTGFTFNSWNTAADGSGTSYADGANYNFATDMTLYAQWDVYVGPCASESFVNSGNSGSYGTETWTGDNGVDWTATESRSDEDLNSDEAIMLNRYGVLSNDNPIAGGCGVISFNYARIFSGDPTFQVWINGNLYGRDITVSSTTSSTFSATVDDTGNINFETTNISTNNDRGVSISNLYWTCYTGTPIPDTQLVDSDGANQNCGYTIDFGTLGRNFGTTDLTFFIENI